MSKRIIALLAGASLTAAAVVTVMAVTGSGNTTHRAALSAVGSVAGAARGQAAPGAAVAGTGKDSVQLLTATTKPRKKKHTAKRATKKPATTVRSVSLQFLPDSVANVGTNVGGLISVVDTEGTATAPVEGVTVALQQKRGKAFVTVSDGTTDAGGQFPVSFTSTVNAVWRAELTSVTGAKKESKTVTSTASALVTWAARPVMVADHGAAISYSFRVGPVTTPQARLEIANSKTPTKWVLSPAVAVPSATGIVVESVKFPKAGTWLVRGASVADPDNGIGHTTALTVTVD